MANYKDIISGAFNKVVDKVKEVKDNGTVRDIYEQGSNRAKGYARIAKLNLEINGHNEELKRLYTEIGKQYYEQAKDAPEGLFVPMFAQAARLVETVHGKEVEIEVIKESFGAENADIDVEVVDDFDEVVDGCCCTSCCCEEDGSCTCTCDDGSTCTCTCGEDGVCTCDDGRSCSCDDNCCTAEDFVDCCCDKAENVVEKIEDVVENICDKVEEKIECCCDKVEEKIDCCCDKKED